MSQGQAVFDMCLPVELGVEEETEPSRWFGFDVELPLYNLVREGDFPSEVPIFRLLLRGGARPGAGEDPGDLGLVFVH
jgi:hypothetical protein